jgi:hypothetical protein
MKKNVLKLGLFSMILVGMVSCKNPQKELADKRITELESFVDSLKTLSPEDKETNWNTIASSFDTKSNNATEAIVALDEKDKPTAEGKVAASKARYDEYKATSNVETGAFPESLTETTTPAANKVDEKAESNPSAVLRSRLFGGGKIGNDMDFSWVNKDNILNVYDDFFSSYKEYKGEFTREDFDEAKLLYEALDSRKNTVEKEGLSAADNGKIAAIKLKLAPMFKINRMGAKSRENQESKE